MGNKQESIQKVRILEKETVKEKEKQSVREPVIGDLQEPQDIRKGTVDSTLTRFFERMTKLERELDEQTQSNTIKLEAVMERTETHFKKVHEDMNRREKNITEQIGSLTSQMMERDERRDRAQLRRDKERDKELDKRDLEQHGRTQKMLEKLAQRVTETERSLRERDISHIGMPPPTLRWPTQDLPSLEPPKPPEEILPTLAG